MIIYNDGGLMAFWAFLGFFALILLLLGVAAYVLSALGLYKLSSNQNIENPWLAWIPIGNLYILGKIIRNLKISSFEVPTVELVLPIGCVIVMILGSFPLVGSLISIAYAILCIFALYKLYNMYRPEQAVLWLVLSIILPFMGPIFIFIMRNDRPKAQ